MKLNILIAIFLLARFFATAQITTPIKPGNFGVDGELDASVYGGFPNTGVDDWFKLNAGGTSLFVIDTTGAAALVAQYVANPASRFNTYYRTMSKPVFSINNNRLWLDALWVRDYHGQDSTVFGSGSAKNGMSPANWAATPYQNIPDKNDILDVLMHIRRQGPNVTDSLWMFGGVSMDNVTGDRYFDFEMYQTDIYYDRPSLQWYGYGPDAGHTSWKFDASGNVITPGDVIFSGSFQSGTLSSVEARIWVCSSDWATVTPAQFNWGGNFDGASSGATFGYASISPKVPGDYYAGMGNSSNSWAGPFNLVLQNNNLQFSNPAPASTKNGYYGSTQFIEFAVNLSKLGLDPAARGSSSICGTPFNRLVVKTRASASFTAQLKDFVAPLSLFFAPRVDVAADIPVFCDAKAVSNLAVTDSSANSIYTWSTPDGHIVGPTTGTHIVVDSPGTYMVMQQLAAGCSPYAYDTTKIIFDPNCGILDINNLILKGTINNDITKLNWTVDQNSEISYFDIERSFDGKLFNYIGRVNADITMPSHASYSAYDDLNHLSVPPTVYYRLKIKKRDGTTSYSKIISIQFSSGIVNVSVSPNPTRGMIQVTINSASKNLMDLYVYDILGKAIRKIHGELEAGANVISLNEFSNLQSGMYIIVVSTGGQTFRQKVVLA